MCLRDAFNVIEIQQKVPRTNQRLSFFASHTRAGAGWFWVKHTPVGYSRVHVHQTLNSFDVYIPAFGINYLAHKQFALQTAATRPVEQWS